jgi:thiol-disulfide isomerase/thioredoxin
MLIFCSFQTYSQKSIDLTITIDSTIDKKSIEMSFFNGNVDADIKDSFENNVLKLKIPFYTEYLPLKLKYKPETGITSSFLFFLKDQKANVLVKQSKGLILFKNSNAILISDTVSNILYREFWKCRDTTAKKMNKLYEKHQGDVFKVDSLSKLRDKYLKELNQESMNFFSEHSSEYFSLYYFWSQVVNVSTHFFKNDSSYLRSLVIFFKNTYPKKYQKSYEGQNILLILEGTIKPPNVNTISPDFSISDINGKRISSESLKGKYILYDFWASWCPPCLASIPFLKELKSKYSSKQFMIIGINTDAQIQEMRKTIINKNINWNQIFDSNHDIFNKFAIGPIPTFILVDREGKIVFRGVGSDDQFKLSKMLDSLILLTIKQ